MVITCSSITCEPCETYCGDFVKLGVVHSSSTRLSSTFFVCNATPSVKALSIRALSLSKRFCFI